MDTDRFEITITETKKDKKDDELNSKNSGKTYFLCVCMQISWLRHVLLLEFQNMEKSE